MLIAWQLGLCYDIYACNAFKSSRQGMNGTLEVKGWQARKADNLTTMCEPIVWKM
jgi:hypothetical protein